MPAITTTELANILPKMIAPARRTVRDRGVMSKLFEVVPLPNKQGKTVNVPKYGTLTAYAGSESTDVAFAQTLSDSNLAITPGFIQVQVFLTDELLRDTPENVLAQMGIIAADGVEVKRDGDLLTLMDGFSTIVPSSGATDAFIPGHVKAAHVTIMGNTTEPGINAGEIYCVCHPFSWHDLSEDMMGLASGAVTYPFPEGLSGELARNYQPQGKLLGLDGLYLDSNITTGTSVKNGVFARRSCIYVPRIVLETKKERDESFGGGGWEINFYSWYGYAEYQDAWGVEIDVDGSAPTT